MAPLLVAPPRSSRRRSGALPARRASRVGALFVASFATLTLAFSALPPSARADLGPPPGWVDCTLEARRAKGEECLACGASARDLERCSRALSAYGFEWACRQDRASIVWTELWCRSPSSSAKKVPAEVLDGLSNASGGVGPPVEPSAPAASSVASGGAASTSTSAPATSAPATSAPATSRPISSSEPLSAPPPVSRPASGCGACTAGALDEAPLAAPLVALAAALAALARRRERKGRAPR